MILFFKFQYNNKLLKIIIKINIYYNYEKNNNLERSLNMSNNKISYRFNLFTKKKYSRHSRDTDLENTYRIIISILSILVLIIMWVIVT